MKQLGHPLQQDFEQYLRGNLIRNCPLTTDNAKRALDIFGPDVQSLQGKNVKRKEDNVPTFIPIEFQNSWRSRVETIIYVLITFM